MRHTRTLVENIQTTRHHVGRSCRLAGPGWPAAALTESVQEGLMPSLASQCFEGTSKGRLMNLCFVLTAHKLFQWAQYRQ
jgi:hypothetical protein